MGSHLINLTFLEKLRGLSLASATLEIEYAMEFYENAIGKEGNGKPSHKIHFPSNNSEPCLWFLLRSKSSMQRNFSLIFLSLIRKYILTMRSEALFDGAQAKIRHDGMFL